jgi:glycosyltransferase involved in cell wall biosynthesis
VKIVRIVERYPSSTMNINVGLMPNAYYLSTLQAQMGHEVKVYTVRHKGQSQRQELDGVEVARVEKPRMSRTFLGLRVSRAMKEAGEEPDIVHVMNPLPLGWLHKRARSILRAKYAMSVHASIGGSGPITGPPTMHKAYVYEFRRLVKNLASHLDLVLPVSHFVRKELEASGIDPDRIRVVPSGVNTEIFLPKNHGSPESFDFLFVGRFSLGKGLDTFLRAIDIMRRDHRPRVLLIGGRPQDNGYGRVMSGIRRMGLQDLVETQPPIPHSMLPHVYNSSSVFVLPSVDEALGKVLLEAMACGRPTAATDVGGITDIVVDGKTGLLVPPEDPEALSEALGELAQDRARRQKMGRRGRRRSIEFDWQTVAKKYISEFETVL